MQPTTASRNARSCETTTTVPAKPRSQSSSHCRPVAVEVVGRLVEEQDRRRRPAACPPAARAPARRPTAAPAAWRGRGGRWPARGAPRRARPPGPSRRAPRSATARGRSAPAWRATCRPRPAAPSSARSSPRTVHSSPSPAPSSSPSVVARVGRLLRQPADALARRRPATAPRSGRSTPASSRSSVDLPTPLGPTSPARSPSPSTNERPSKSGAPSYAFVRSDACNMESSCVVREAGGLGRGKRDGHTAGVRGRPPPSAPPHARAREVVPRRPEIVCGGCLLHRGAA